MEELILTKLLLGKREIQYYVLIGQEINGFKPYGIKITCANEKEIIPDITRSQSDVLDLLVRMARGSVTPVSAREIVEDWLLI